MNIDELQKLAGLDLDDDQRRELREDLDRLKASIDRLRGVEVSGTEPARQPVDIPSVERPDEAAEPLSTDRTLDQAPAHSRDHVSVPPVLSRDDDAD